MHTLLAYTGRNMISFILFYKEQSSDPGRPIVFAASFIEKLYGCFLVSTVVLHKWHGIVAAIINHKSFNKFKSWSSTYNYVHVRHARMWHGIENDNDIHYWKSCACMKQCIQVLLFLLHLTNLWEGPRDEASHEWFRSYNKPTGEGLIRFSTFGSNETSKLSTFAAWGTLLKLGRSCGIHDWVVASYNT